MSDYRAVAAMTETLRNMLQDAIAGEFPGARVQTNRPQRDPPDPRHGLINIFLYLVEFNPSWRNMELPVRARDGSLLHAPRAALDLHYLVSFYGSDEQQIPQLLLGKTVALLQKTPYPPARFLPRQPPEGEPAPVERYLRIWESGISEQLQQIQFVPLTLSHDELSKLWTIFFQTPYVLSLAYRCSVILIEPEMEEVPIASLPVRQVKVYDVTTELPQIDQVLPQMLTAEPGARLLLRGRNLGGVTGVEVGGLPAPVRNSTPTSLLVDLPAGLSSGVNLVQATRDVAMGSPPVTHRIYSSNPVSVLLRPRLLSQPTYEPLEGGTVATALAPAVRAEQKAALLLNRLDGSGDQPPVSYQLPAAAGSVGASQLFRVRGVEPGTYLLRVQVDGVATELFSDSNRNSPTFDRMVAPTVTIPAPTASGAAP